MPIYTIHHTTTYRYAHPVGFGEHRFLLKPLEANNQRLLSFKLAIQPEAVSLIWAADDHGNQVGKARFRGRAKVLQFDATMCVEQRPGEIGPAWPMTELGNSTISRNGVPRGDSQDPVTAWARSFRTGQDAQANQQALLRINRSVRSEFTYVRREERGIQEPVLTLSRKSGSCRDFALLVMQAAHAFGIPARFVSGYLHVPNTSDKYWGGGSTHAWAQAFLPELGWTDLDPTNGTVGSRGLIPVAVSPDPMDLVPLSGTYIGLLSDFIGMDVSVRVSEGETGGSRLKNVV